MHRFIIIIRLHNIYNYYCVVMDSIIDSGKHSRERNCNQKRQNVLGQKGFESNGVGCSLLLFQVKVLKGDIEILI